MTKPTQPTLNYVLCPDTSQPDRQMAYWEWNATGNPAHPHIVVCVHGLSRQGRDFDTLARALAPHVRVICPDVAGRGQSDWLTDSSRYHVPQYAADICVLLAHLADLAHLNDATPLQTIDWVGTSMGGLIGMVLCGQPGLPLPVPIRRLVLNDVGPVIEWEALSRIGDYVGQMGHFESLQDAADTMGAVSSHFGPHTPAQWLALCEHMVRPLPDGGFTLHYDPAIAEPFRALSALSPEAAQAGEAAMWQLYDNISAQTLLIRGKESDLLSTTTAKAMEQRGPSAVCVEFEGVGHAPTLVAPDQVAVVTQFLLKGAA